MFGNIMFYFEGRKDLLIGITLSVMYLTYYLVEVVKKPVLVCGSAALRAVLEAEVGVLRERYWPPAWCVEGRLHTVLASLLRTALLPPLSFRRELVVLPDGGTVALDWQEGAGAGAGAGAGQAAGDGAGRPRAVLLVLPGLTGGAHADYVRCLAAAAGLARAQLVVYNNRGLAGLTLTSPRLYCAVSHEDFGAAAAAAAARARELGVPLLAVGVSLGGLILCQYLAAQGDKSLVRGALVISSPLDVERGSACIERPVLNSLLSLHMARNLRRTIASHDALQSACAVWDREAVRRSRSLRQFDAAFTARHFGFSSVDAYYRAATLTDKLENIRVPTLCLCAADDPFQPAEVLPVSACLRSSHVALAVTARGGHIGFLERSLRPLASHYMARLAHQYLCALLNHKEMLEPPTHAAPAATVPAKPAAAVPATPAATAPATPAEVDT